MARRTATKAPPVNGNGHRTGFIASGQILDFTSDADRKRYKKAGETWQADAWRYYDSLGEIWFAHQFVGNCLRKIRIFAAEQPDQSRRRPPSMRRTRVSTARRWRRSTVSSTGLRVARASYCMTWGSISGCRAKGYCSGRTRITRNAGGSTATARSPIPTTKIG